MLEETLDPPVGVGIALRPVAAYLVSRLWHRDIGHLLLGGASRNRTPTPTGSRWSPASAAPGEWPATSTVTPSTPPTAAPSPSQSASRWAIPNSRSSSSAAMAIFSAIGGNHLIHAARRNVDLTVFCVNNFTYGMTGGQAGPTTQEGAKASTSPYGNVETPFNLPLLVAAAGATYVARWTVLDLGRLRRSMVEAMAHSRVRVRRDHLAVPGLLRAAEPARRSDRRAPLLQREHRWWTTSPILTSLTSSSAATST